MPTYLINRTPTNLLGERTPYEMLFGYNQPMTVFECFDHYVMLIITLELMINLVRELTNAFF